MNAYIRKAEELWTKADALRRGLSPSVRWMTPDDVARSKDIDREDAERVLQAAELDEEAEEILNAAERGMRGYNA